MNVYEAIVKAAWAIENHPQEFDFNSQVYPPGPGCGTPGCALGWIGTFLGKTGRGIYRGEVRPARAA